MFKLKCNQLEPKKFQTEIEQSAETETSCFSSGLHAIFYTGAE